MPDTSSTSTSAATAAPTLAQLQAQQVSLSQQIAQTQVKPFTDAYNAVTDPAIISLLQKLQDASGGMAEGEAKVQVGNVINVLTLMPGILKAFSDANSVAANPSAPAPVTAADESQPAATPAP